MSDDEIDPDGEHEDEGTVMEVDDDVVIVVERETVIKERVRIEPGRGHDRRSEDSGVADRYDRDGTVGSGPSAVGPDGPDLDPSDPEQGTRNSDAAE